MDLGRAQTDPLALAILAVKSSSEGVGNDERLTTSSVRDAAIATGKVILSTTLYDESTREKLTETFKGLSAALFGKPLFQGTVTKQNRSLLSELLMFCALVRNGVPVYPVTIDLLQTRELAQPARLLIDPSEVEISGGKLMIVPERGDGLDVVKNPSGVYPFVVPMSYVWKRRIKSGPAPITSGTVHLPRSGEGHTAISTKDRSVQLVGEKKKLEKPVLYAGNVQLVEGHVVAWNNDSGHYRPGDIRQDGIGALSCALLEALALPFPRDKFVDRTLSLFD